MALVFRTPSDSPLDVEIAGVGRLAGNGRGGIPVERAANSRRMEEFLDPKTREPLTGSKLTAAARKFAEARGLVTDNVKDVDEEALVVEAGGFPRGPTIEELSREAAARDAAVPGAAEFAMRADVETPDVEPPPPPRDLPVTAEPLVSADEIHTPSGEEAR